MGYILRMYVDGGCRRNGSQDAIGAAACVIQYKHGRQKSWTKRLPDYPDATNQRAELTALILALELGLQKYRGLRSYPFIDVTIYSDSRYAVNCMTEWKAKWLGNGFYSSKGVPLVNQDLIEKAYELEEELANEGDVEFVWVPREENEDADDRVNEELDEMEQELY